MNETNSLILNIVNNIDTIKNSHNTEVEILVKLLDQLGISLKSLKAAKNEADRKIEYLQLNDEQQKILLQFKDEEFKKLIDILEHHKGLVHDLATDFTSQCESTRSIYEDPDFITKLLGDHG